MPLFETVRVAADRGTDLLGEPDARDQRSAYIEKSAFPEDFPVPLPDEEILGRGGAAIIELRGGSLAEPNVGQSPSTARRARTMVITIAPRPKAAASPASRAGPPEMASAESTIAPATQPPTAAVTTI